MSACSSVTTRDDSREPSPKRQKTDGSNEGLAYGSKIVLIEARGKPVAAVPKEAFDQAFQHAPSTEMWLDSNVPGNFNIEKINFEHNKDVIQFIVHWIHERDIDVCLDRCQRNDAFFMCEIIKLACDQSFHDELHDSVIDHIIDQMRARKTIECLASKLINEIYEAVEDVLAGDEQLIFLSRSMLLELLATLHIHHQHHELSINPRDNRDEKRQLGLLHDVRSHAMGYLLEQFSHGGDAALPQDPLEDGFDQYCLYHWRATSMRCYRTKLSSESQKT